jgi:ArsR family transcriptional regulator, arsenate/arsenite/antimonite-responsive transcriptional repressor
MFRAVSDPVRLRILHLLRSGESCVGDLVTVLQVPQPTASRHLRYLRRAGLARCRKYGLWCFYSRTPATSPLHRRVLECVDLACGDLPEVIEDAARARELRKTGGCCPDAGAPGSCRTRGQAETTKLKPRT